MFNPNLVCQPKKMVLEKLHDPFPPTLPAGSDAWFKVKAWTMRNTLSLVHPDPALL
jgi:hypothetical protein